MNIYNLFHTVIHFQFLARIHCQRTVMFSCEEAYGMEKLQFVANGQEDVTNLEFKLLISKEKKIKPY